MNARDLPIAAAICLLGFLLSGCGSHQDANIVKGQVTYRGDPVEKGVIEFTKISPGDASRFEADIVGGEYIVDIPRHLTAADYSVAIRSDSPQAGVGKRYAFESACRIQSSAENIWDFELLDSFQLPKTLKDK